MWSRQELDASRPKRIQTIFLVLLGAGLAAAAARAQTFTVLHDFGGPDGSQPMAALLQASDGSLYGTTASACAELCSGTMFRLDPWQFFRSLHSFDGSLIFTSALIQASDGLLYGATYNGGQWGWGSIFSSTLQGDVTNVHDFNPNEGNTVVPIGVIQGTDGNFYGLTRGLYDRQWDGGYICEPGLCAEVFKLDLGGVVTDLHVFDASDLTVPVGPLLLASNGLFYGTTTQPTAIFSIDSSGSSYVPICSFGGSPLIQATDGYFYGSDGDDVFRIDEACNATTIHTFTGSEGRAPGTLLEAADGYFYGMTINGGANDSGTIFRLTPSGVLTTLHEFDGVDGQGSNAPLVQSADGSFYGTTNGGGAAGLGTIFRVSPCPLASEPLVITVDKCLPPNTSGLVASVSGNPADAYRWTVFGGTISSGQGTQTITFASGSEAIPLRIFVYETDSQGCLGSAFAQAGFSDVPPSDPFHPYVCTIAEDGVTAGCGDGSFCGGDPVTRAQMAVFLLKAKLGADYLPPPCIPPGVFPDAPCPGDPPTFAVDWIEDLYHRGITAGYADGRYGPADPVTRAQMAVFLLKASLGTDYTPPSCTPPGVFVDVPCPGAPPSFAVDWIEDLFHRGIAAGYGNGRFGPDDPNTRGQMAVFLVKAFGLH
jgi:uncharacterized repeat protein (TIGR03803 family)